MGLKASSFFCFLLGYKRVEHPARATAINSQNTFTLMWHLLTVAPAMTQWRSLKATRGMESINIYIYYYKYIIIIYKGKPLRVLDVQTLTGYADPLTINITNVPQLPFISVKHYESYTQNHIRKGGLT